MTAGPPGPAGRPSADGGTRASLRKPAKAASRFHPPRPPWITVPGIAMQGCGMFLLPFVVGFVGALVFEASQVVETGTAMTGLTLLVLFPISLGQILGATVKTWRDVRFWRAHGGLGVRRFLDVVHTHLSVVTFRGWMLLFLALCLVLAALGAQWAELGLMAVFGLFLFYVVTGWTVFASTFLTRTLESGGGNRVERRTSPTVVQTGDEVEEVFTFKNVPIPWGFVLVVEDPLPVRLRTESRYVISAGLLGSGQIESRGVLRATPRGHYFLGPARMAYQDLLGITSISLSGAAAAELKVLPRFRTVEIVDPPKTPQVTPDIVTKPHRFPTEDYFRFREFLSGDDTRRIHWRLSLKSGQLQVRKPETREIDTQDVLLVLDDYLPPGRLLDSAHGADEILDGLVEAWLGIARSLIDRGDRVTLVAAITGHDRDEVVVMRHACRKGEMASWQDMGARARWQGRYDLQELLEDLGRGAHGVVVTARFGAAIPEKKQGQAMTWLFLDPVDALGPPDRPWIVDVVGGPGILPVLSWIVRLPYPVGDEENSLPYRLRGTWRIIRRHDARARLRLSARRSSKAAVKAMFERGDAVYRIERLPNRIRLVGQAAP